MALVNCPECGRQVSDTAKACPGCGFAIASGLYDLKSSRLVARMGCQVATPDYCYRARSLADDRFGPVTIRLVEVNTNKERAAFLTKGMAEWLLLDTPVTLAVYVDWLPYIGPSRITLLPGHAYEFYIDTRPASLFRLQEDRLNFRECSPKTDALVYDKDAQRYCR